MRELQGEIDGTVSSMSEESWSRGVYESGWNARQLLSHIASISGTAGFVLSMARMPSAPSLGAGFDEDGFNARLVAEREGKSTAELLGEIKGNFERDVEAVRAAPDELIRKQFRAPWESRAGWGTSSWSHSKGTWACISWTCVSQSTRGMCRHPAGFALAHHGTPRQDS